MDTAKQHWEILGRLDTDLANRVREFMVIGEEGEGLLVATEDGQGFWFWFGDKLIDWDESTIPTKLTPLNVPDLIQMAHGDEHIVMLNKLGELYSIGENDRGQLGLGTVDDNIYFPPQLISIPQHKFISVRCGQWHSLALTDDGKVWAWGVNEFGQLGVPKSTVPFPSPHQIPELDSHPIVAVECGGSHSLALTNQGEVYTWGENDCGQLGDGTRLSTHIPTRISTPSPVRSMAAGYGHTLLLTQTGEVWACGWNDDGQLGLTTDIKTSPRLSKVAGLPSISQIASHFATDLSIAMSQDKRCFAWGRLRDEKSKGKYIPISTPLKLPLFYSTVDSPISSFATHRNTPHSVSIPESPLSQMTTRMSRMFDNPEFSDVQFMVEQKTIHAHRIILSNSSEYFAIMFSERWLGSLGLKDPIIKVTISDHSYQAFYAFLRFLYTDSLEVHLNFLPKVFELANLYLVPGLQQLCISRMRITLTTATCSIYYPLTYRHSLPELNDFQQELVQFVSTRMSEVMNSPSYKSMEPYPRCKLINAAYKFATSNLSNK